MSDTKRAPAEDSSHDPRPYVIRRECWHDDLVYSLGNTEFYAERFGCAETMPAVLCIADVLADDWHAVLPSDDSPGWVPRPPGAANE